MNIWGNVVGNLSPKANWNQEDSTKADYVIGRDAVNAAIKKAQGDAEKARHKRVQVVLLANTWVNKAQTVDAAGVTADNTVFVDYPKTSKLEADYAGVAADSQSDGKITFTCEAVPATDITVNLAIFD